MPGAAAVVAVAGVAAVDFPAAALLPAADSPSAPARPHSVRPRPRSVPPPLRSFLRILVGVVPEARVHLPHRNFRRVRDRASAGLVGQEGLVAWEVLVG
jgi:hypothetical protein